MRPEDFVNTAKQKNTEPSAEADERVEVNAAPKKKSRSLYDLTDLSRIIRFDSISSQLPFILFIAFLILLYIANNHYAMKSIKKLNQSELQLKQLKWEYINLKSDLERKSQQSYIATQLQPIGIKSLRQPPQKIIQEEHVEN